MDDTTAQITLRVRSTQTSAPCPLWPPPRGASIVTMGAPWRTCLGTVSGVPPAARAQVVEPQSRLSASYLHRTAAHRGRPLGAPHPTAYPAPGRPRYGAGGEGWDALGQQWDLALSRNTLLQATPAAGPIVSHTQGAGRRRFRPAQTAHLRHDPGGSRAPAAQALLPERTAEPVAQVAPGAPGVEVIRDRLSAYGDGARHGAPALPRLRTVFISLRISGKRWTRCSARTARHSTRSMCWCTSSLYPSLMGRWPCLCHPRTSRSLRSSAPCSARAAGRRSIRKSGPCTARGGRPLPSRSTWG